MNKDDNIQKTLKRKMCANDNKRIIQKSNMKMNYNITRHNITQHKIT